MRERERERERERDKKKELYNSQDGMAVLTLVPSIK